MEFIKREHKATPRTFNLSSGGFMEKYFTEEEKARYDRRDVPIVHGCYSLEAQVTLHCYTTHLRVDRSYVEKKLGLRPLLRIIHKLGKNKRGAISKQLYPYYEKVGISAMKGDLAKLYQEKERIDISDPSDRKHYHTDLYIHSGRHAFWSHGGESALADITKHHLNRCLAILIDKGYLTTEQKQSHRTFKRSANSYTYKKTYYTLTDKALLYIGEEVNS